MMILLGIALIVPAVLLVAIVVEWFSDRRAWRKAMRGMSDEVTEFWREREGR